MVRARYVPLDEAAPADAVVVVDVLRAFTTAAWAMHRGASRVLAVDSAEAAFALRRDHVPDALMVGEDGGAPLAGFDLGNSPSELRRHEVAERTMVHRTSAGTQGLVRTAGSRLVLATGFVTAGAVARYLASHGADEVTFVITGVSHGRDGDEDLACAELIAARLAGGDPDPAPFVDRVAHSDAGAYFAESGPDWAPPEDLRLACEVDRFDFALVAQPAAGLGAVEVTRAPAT